MITQTTKILVVLIFTGALVSAGGCLPNCLKRKKPKPRAYENQKEEIKINNQPTKPKKSFIQKIKDYFGKKVSKHRDPYDEISLSTFDDSAQQYTTHEEHNKEPLVTEQRCTEDCLYGKQNTEKQFKDKTWVSNYKVNGMNQRNNTSKKKYKQPYETEKCSICTKKPKKSEYAIKQCSFCWENIKKSGNTIKLLPKEGGNDCGHEYHKNCLIKYKELSKNGCPLCRNTDFIAVIKDENGDIETIEKDEYARRFYNDRADDRDVRGDDVGERWRADVEERRRADFEEGWRRWIDAELNAELNARLMMVDAELDAELMRQRFESERLRAEIAEIENRYNELN